MVSCIAVILQDWNKVQYHLIFDTFIVLRDFKIALGHSFYLWLFKFVSVCNNLFVFFSIILRLMGMLSHLDLFPDRPFSFVSEVITIHTDTPESAYHMAIYVH